MNKTGISWTDYTWNPVTGCSKISEGCKYCYAERWAKRWHIPFSVKYHEDRLVEVRKIPSGSRVFVNSMSDLFHNEVTFEQIRAIFKVIEKRIDVTFQILTKRPYRAKQYNTYYLIPDNVWLGVSVELSKYKDRIDTLREIYVKHRFVSFEPLLGDVGTLDLTDIEWVIVGGESGPKHRYMKLEWVRNIRDQAVEQGVSFYMKQLGGIHPNTKLNDLPIDLRIREFPKERDQT